MTDRLPTAQGSQFDCHSHRAPTNIDRPFGVVGCPIGSNRPTTPLGAVDRHSRSDRLPHGSSRLLTDCSLDCPSRSSRSTASLGAVDSLLGSSRSTAPFGVVDGMKFNLAGVLGSVPLTTDDEGPSSPGQAKRRKTATKAKRVAGDKNALVSVGRAMEDDHIDLTRDADPIHADDDHTVGDSHVPDLRFPPAHAGRDMKVMRSCVISHMSEGLSRRKIEDIEKVLAIYNRKVLTLEDSLVKACKRMVTDLEVEDEKSKEIHHLKKKNSSLRKSYEASEARVKEREDEIDNLRSALARAQHDAVESYKASSEYQQDLYVYGAESMSASISLTKEWISTEHLGVNLQGFDRFLARRRDLEQATEQGQATKLDGVDDQADDPHQDGDAKINEKIHVLEGPFSSKYIKRT
ncbi:Uncharacterized protein Fot_03193 [Forsythia ovata]|uniref:Uncharacterized protein n=1 Tax=Forsythia ovata TaxID=205694 RepID=A0ABD1X950_9LAMI